MAKLYIETSIVSYLTARPSGNLTAAAWQKETMDWWEIQRGRFSLCISDLVVEEASRGDGNAVKRRLAVLEGIKLLPLTDEAVGLSKALVENGGVPEKALDDALHIAIAAVHGINYLLTWNCRHIDNAETKPIIRRICRKQGFSCPEIATPIELMGAENHDR
uniref:Predicted nucleic acid-binding protein, contains PIN domain n=1 Tax=Candidatus Kentrum sp. TUN TaxID=2126343 RepID=A0A450ZRK1_9GAMM|nr:MAG: Predicted nucleic acid-binding protein, contains PIN domain [Candidatus Kentron sp. TUN]VFK59037.1 MAG: Predicted nucleic acid-binding protein, contains PIN domain [Candidatus Kentron sp. TUN]VFK62759.1 MAG: Predicted nucleic acid-binding protein, contains PIN domain [Candidatus Kentron sp. TUN]